MRTARGRSTFVAYIIVLSVYRCLKLNIHLQTHAYWCFSDDRMHIGVSRTTELSTGQVQIGKVRTGQGRTGQDRTSQDRTGQVRTGQVRTGQVCIIITVTPTRTSVFEPLLDYL